MRLVDHPALVAAARHGLADRDSRSVVTREEAAYVLGCLRTDHLSGLLWHAVAAGTVEVDGDTERALAEEWHGELNACVRLEALVVRTAELLDDAGITWRLTKGPALAHLDYRDPSLRTFGDVDIVVHPNDWSDAFQLLSSHGFRREGATLPGGYDDRFGKGATLVTDEHLELDLHRRFAIGRFAIRSRMQDLFTNADGITLGGRTIPTFDPAGRLLHACFHALLGRGALLRAFRDIAQLLLVTQADWEATFGIARSWRAEAIVAAAINETWERLELDVEHPALARARGTRISPTDARLLREWAVLPFRTQVLSALPRLPPQELPRYVWFLAAAGRARRR